MNTELIKIKRTQQGPLDINGLVLNQPPIRLNILGHVTSCTRVKVMVAK